MKNVWPWPRNTGHYSPATINHWLDRLEYYGLPPCYTWRADSDAAGGTNLQLVLTELSKRDYLPARLMILTAPDSKPEHRMDIGLFDNQNKPIKKMMPWQACQDDGWWLNHYYTKHAPIVKRFPAVTVEMVLADMEEYDPHHPAWPTEVCNYTAQAVEARQQSLEALYQQVFQPRRGTVWYGQNWFMPSMRPDGRPSGAGHFFNRLPMSQYRTNNPVNMYWPASLAARWMLHQYKPYDSVWVQWAGVWKNPATGKDEESLGVHFGMQTHWGNFIRCTQCTEDVVVYSSTDPVISDKLPGYKQQRLAANERVERETEAFVAALANMPPRPATPIIV